MLQGLKVTGVGIKAFFSAGISLVISVYDAMIMMPATFHIIALLSLTFSFIDIVVNGSRKAAGFMPDNVNTRGRSTRRAEASHLGAYTCVSHL